MDKFQLKSQFTESATKFGSQLKHTWVNVCRNESKSSKHIHQILKNEFILHSNYQTHFQCITKNH
jgi:hypothetical protein